MMHTPDAHVRTHRALDRTLCGESTALGAGRATVAWVAPSVARADALDLVHGGFLFGVADHAAMLAVNEANVVLVAAETRFLLPVRVGDRLEARATLRQTPGRRMVVDVSVVRGDDEVMSGEFHCAVPRRHVLERPV